MQFNAINTIGRVLSAPEDQRERLMEQTNRDLGLFFSRPQNHMHLQEVAFEIVGLAWADAMTDNIIERIIETKTVDFTATDYIDERNMRGLRAYWQGKGGRILSSVLRYGERISMPREEMVAALDLHQDEIQTNFWGSMTTLQDQYEEKLRQLPVARLLALVNEALPTGSTFDGNPLSSTFAMATATEADIDGIIRTVSRASGGAPVAIVGTENSLSVFGRLGGTYTDLAARIFLEGTAIIGQYKGRPLVQVANFEDFHGELVLPEDELWIVGRNAGRLTFYGAQAKAQILTLEAFYQRWETARDAGMLLYGAEQGRVGRIIFS